MYYLTLLLSTGKGRIMGARIKQNIILQNRIIYSIMSPKHYAQCIVKFWKNNAPQHNTHILSV